MIAAQTVAIMKPATPKAPAAIHNTVVAPNIINKIIVKIVFVVSFSIVINPYI